jgi:hypothetical protein
VHTTMIDDLAFHHNGDYSGEVLVSRPDDQEPGWATTTFRDLAAAALAEAAEPLTLQADRAILTIPVATLRELMGRRLVDEEIGVLEQLTGTEALAGAGSSSPEQRLERVKEWARTPAGGNPGGPRRARAR